jgi:RNA polymerase sigma-B factor
MLGETERSPMFAAPGSRDVTTVSTYTILVGLDDDDIQAANDLCEKYLPLARSIARKYQGRGISYEDLQSASELGLFKASRRFDPGRGAFGAYAAIWAKGEITKLFKSSSDPIAFGRPQLSLETPVGPDSDESFTLKDVLADDRTDLPCPDLSNISEREKRVVLGTVAGETLKELGTELGVSQERVSQINVAATKKLRKKPGQVALACIRDLTKRRGYHKPSRELLPYNERTYPGRHYSKAEIEAYEPQKWIAPPKTLPPLWVNTPSSRRTPSRPKVEIKRDGSWRTLKRAAEIGAFEAAAQALANSLRGERP